MKFLYYYIRSMRLYYCFLTGSATLAGVISAIGSASNFSWKAVIIAVIGFLSWGVNQIINDFFDRKEDKVNAPHRPMVTGQLPAKKALFVSIVIMLMFGIVSAVISPWTLLPIGIGFLFNVLYSFAKGIPLIGNACYAVSISMCTLYGFLGARRYHDTLEVIIVLNLCWILAISHLTMCLYSTLKDIQGDQTAGKKTPAVVWGPKVTQILGSIFWMLLMGIYAAGMVFCFCEFSIDIIIAWLWCILLGIWNIIQWKKNLTHKATKANCQSCVAQQLFPLSLSMPWGLAIMGGSWIIIELIFKWYPDEKE